MNCNETETKIVDYLDGNLSKEEAQQFDLHIASCESCAKALNETKTLLTTISNVEAEKPREHVHLAFTEMLEKEKEKLSKTNDTKVIPLSWKTAFQIAASLLLLLTGYVTGDYFSTNRSNSQIVMLQKQSDELKTEMTLALMDNRSVSKRIQAVNYSEEMVQPDTKILEAIIERMQYDVNVNVRLSAAEALSRFSENNLVREAFINALGNEKNPDIQIAVIQFLVEAQDKRALVPMQQLLEEPEVPIFVKRQLDEGVKQLL